MARKTKQKRSILLKIFMLVACGYIIFTLSSYWSELNDAEKEKQALLEQRQQLIVSIKDNEEMLKDESNRSIIEKAARERLGFIYSDEQIFKDISGN